MSACVHTSGRCKTVFRPAARSLRVPTAHVNRSTAARAAAKASIEFEDLLDVIKAVDESDVVEMALKGKKFAMSVKKQEALQAQEPVYVQAAAAPAAAPAPAPVAPQPAAPAAAPAPPSAPSGGGAKSSGGGGSEASGVEMVAPMSGTVYRKPAPGEPQFVKEGDKVTVGQSVCIIEAMKLMNEIEADTAGTIVKFVAEDTKPIAPGDVICIIDPSG